MHSDFPQLGSLHSFDMEYRFGRPKVYLAPHELARLAHERGITPIHQAIAWVLSNPAVTSCILGSKSPQQVSEQVEGAEIHLSEDHLRQIAAIAVRAPIVAPV